MTETSTGGQLYWDPIDPTLRDDPYPLWRRLRDEAPVWHNDRYDFYVLSRFHDIEAAHKDPIGFSSAHGTTFESLGPDVIQTGMMIWTDPPKHSVLRKLVSRAFTGRRVSELEDRIREMCADLLDAQAESGSFDYVQDFAATLPPNVISTMLGVPEPDRDHLRHRVDAIFAIDAEGNRTDDAAAAGAEVFGYLGEQFRERRTHPRDDMFTDLLEAEISDDDATVRRLSDMELTEFGMMLFIAGTETVARHLGWAADVLEANPGQRAELAADASLIPNAVEEILRYEAPSPVNGRWTTVDVSVHGTTIPAGSAVYLLTGSAGRDERKYPNPDSLDVRRAVDLHLTFGYGTHFCLGAALARLEGRIGIEETLRRWPEYTVDREAAKLLYTSTVRGYVNLPVSV
jgi:cytochrome P450